MAFLVPISLSCVLYAFSYTLAIRASAVSYMFVPFLYALMLFWASFMNVIRRLSLSLRPLFTMYFSSLATFPSFSLITGTANFFRNALSVVVLPRFIASSICFASALVFVAEDVDLARSSARLNASLFGPLVLDF